MPEKKAIFDVEVKVISEPKPAKINDELAKKYGASSLKELREQISERLKAEYANATRAILKRDLMDKLDKSLKFEVPSGLITSESNEIAYQLWREENPDAKDQERDKITPTDLSSALKKHKIILFTVAQLEC